MCYPDCGMVHIKEPLLLFGKSSPCGGSRFTICVTKAVVCFKNRPTILPPVVEYWLEREIAFPDRFRHAIVGTM